MTHPAIALAALLVFTTSIGLTQQSGPAVGAINIRTTVNQIARSSSGRIYNERRQLVAASFKGEPHSIGQIDRHEPDASLLAVPSGYKLVDETPPEPAAEAPHTGQP